MFPTLPRIDLKGADFQTHLARGYTGVAYPVDLFPLEWVTHFIGLSRECFRSDDLTISYALALAGVPIVANAMCPKDMGNH
jgi:hypothetical protein